jgi:hypothetical protein
VPQSFKRLAAFDENEQMFGLAARLNLGPELARCQAPIIRLGRRSNCRGLRFRLNRDREFGEFVACRFIVTFALGGAQTVQSLLGLSLRHAVVRLFVQIGRIHAEFRRSRTENGAGLGATELFVARLYRFKV